MVRRLKKIMRSNFNHDKKNEVRFHPSLWINTFKHWINNIQPWCISRQILGHRIPIWYSNKGDMIAAKKADAEKIKKINKLAVISHQETDVLDTGFLQLYGFFNIRRTKI